MRPEDLPPPDPLVLSHLHGDHFDRIAKDRLARDLPVVTTGHAARKLERWGFRETRAVDTWQMAEFERDGQRLRVTACPGQHGPGLMRHVLPPVMGSIIELERDGVPALRLYITGDTLCRPYLRDIADRFPDMDGMIIHVGGTRVLGVLVTMNGPQGADLVEMIGPPVTVPIHYDDYTVFKAPLSDFTSEVKRRGLPTTMRTVGRGETVTLPTRRPVNVL